MIMKIYSVQDTLIGFGAPVIYPKEELVKRDYKNMLQNDPNSADKRLYEIGTFDTETGTIIGITPKCIMGGNVKWQE